MSQKRLFPEICSDLAEIGWICLNYHLHELCKVLWSYDHIKTTFWPRPFLGYNFSISAGHGFCLTWTYKWAETCQGDRYTQQLEGEPHKSVLKTVSRRLRHHVSKETFSTNMLRFSWNGLNMSELSSTWTLPTTHCLQNTFLWLPL